MARFRKQKSRKQQAADLAAKYLKFKAVQKTAKGTAKTVSKTPVLKRVPVVVAAAGATFAAVKIFKGRGGSSPAPA